MTEIGPSTLTERLELRPMLLADLDPLFEIFSDPAGWWFDPAGRHTTPDETLALIERAATGWVAHGLSYWTARLRDHEQVIGMGGVRRKDGTWNLAYRFAAAHQGHGFATEVSLAAVTSARAAEPGIPVVAWIDEPNTASIHVAEKAGLRAQGPRTDPSDGVRRLLYADRPLG